MAIVVAIAIVVSSFSFFFFAFRSPDISRPQVIVGSLNDWQKERQFKVLNEQKEDRDMKVIRDGVEKMINTKVFLLLSLLINPSLQFLP